MLHEFLAPVPLLHQQFPPSCVPNSDRKRQTVRQRFTGSAALLLPASIFWSSCWWAIKVFRDVTCICTMLMFLTCQVRRSSPGPLAGILWKPSISMTCKSLTESCRIDSRKRWKYVTMGTLVDIHLADPKISTRVPPRMVLFRSYSLEKWKVTSSVSMSITNHLESRITMVTKEQKRKNAPEN